MDTLLVTLRMEDQIVEAVGSTRTLRGELERLKRNADSSIQDAVAALNRGDAKAWGQILMSRGIELRLPVPEVRFVPVRIERIGVVKHEAPNSFVGWLRFIIRTAAIRLACMV